MNDAQSGARTGGARKRGKKPAALPLTEPPARGNTESRMRGNTESLMYSHMLEQAKSHGPDCIRALADEVANNSGAPRISAAKELLDRGYGKVGQPLEPAGPDGGPASSEAGVSPEVASLLRILTGIEE